MSALIVTCVVYKSCHLYGAQSYINVCLSKWSQPCYQWLNRSLFFWVTFSWKERNEEKDRRNEEEGTNANPFSTAPWIKKNKNLVLDFWCFPSIYVNKWGGNGEKVHEILDTNQGSALFSLSVCLPSHFASLALALLASCFVSRTSGGRWAKKGNGLALSSFLF